MSQIGAGREYEGIHIAYGLPADDERARLFFKMTFDNTESKLVVSEDAKALKNDEYNGFFDRDDSRWSGNATREIKNFVADVHPDGAEDPDANKIKEGLTQIMNSDETTRHRMLALVDKVYTFKNSSGTTINAEKARNTSGLTVSLKGGSKEAAVPQDVRERFGGGSAGQGKKHFRFHAGKIQYQDRYGPSKLSSGVDLVAHLTGPKNEGMEKVVQLTKDGEWQIKDGDEFVSVKKYMENTENCELIGSSLKDQDKCYEVAKCLSKTGYRDVLGIEGQEVDDTCFEKIVNSKHWALKNKDTLKKIDPATAFFFLKALCFRGNLSDGVVKVENVGDWYKRFNNGELKDDAGKAPKATQAQLKTLKEQYLAGFQMVLNNLVMYVNANPDILNGKGSKVKIISDPDPYGLKSAIGGPSGHANYLHEIKPIIATGALSNQLIAANMMNPFGRGMIGGGQLGGAAAAQIRKHVVDYGDKLPAQLRYSNALKGMYTVLCKRLKGLGKDLNQKTKDAIDNLFSGLEDSETRLLKTLQAFHAFAEEARRNPGNVVQGDIGAGELDKAYTEFTKRNKKNERRGWNLVDILRTIANGISEIEVQKSNVNLKNNF